MNDWLDFVSSIVDSLAWPACLAFVVYFLRTEIKSLVPFLRRVRFAWFDAEFGEKVERLEEKAEEAELPSVAAEETSEVESPRTIILENWIKLEARLMDVANQQGLLDKFRNVNVRLIAELEQRSAVSPEIAGLIRDLRALRNEAAHSSQFDLSRENALDYASLTARVIATLPPGIYWN